jgi:hypothetical protein
VRRVLAVADADVVGGATLGRGARAATKVAATTAARTN